MGANRHGTAFTLIEVLIVVVIVAILASIVLPKFGATTDDAKESVLVSTTHTLRSQIEIYKHHHGAYPSLTDNGLPQMLTKTDVTGAANASGPFGPYFDGDIPPNPVDLSSMVYPAASDPPVAVTPDGKGWQYDEATGGIWPNNPKFWEAK